MKIFIVVDCLTIGGAERVACDMASGLSRRGHQVSIYTNTSYPISYKPDESVQVTDFKPKSILKCYSPIMFLSREIKQEKPSVLIGICGYLSFICKSAQIISGLKIPVVYSEHNSLDRPANAKLNLQNWFYKFCFSKWCDAMTVLTEADKRFAQGKLRNLHVMPNPLGLIPCNTVPKKEKIILAVGRLKAWNYKGFDILIDAWGRVSAKFPDWKLIIVGKGSQVERNIIYSFAKKFQCEKQFELYPYTEDIISFYQNASIYALSSRYEGFGLVLIEAMSQGCACVATDYKGRQSEIITDGVDGILCSPDKVEFFSKGLEKLISDDDYRTQLQKTALETSRHFTVSHYAEMWEALLYHLTNHN